MDKKLRSIVDELCDYVPERDKEHFIETRVMHVIASMNNLRKLIEETYDEEKADELNRRLTNAARSGDVAKVTRKLREYKKDGRRG